MKRLLIGKNKYALVDNADYDKLRKFKWSPMTRKRTTYAFRTFYRADGLRTSVYLHRVVTNASDGLEVDHINGNGLDNRRENLRVVSKTVNMRNSYKHRSGVIPGIHKRPDGRYTIQQWARGTVQYVGSARTIEDAIRKLDDYRSSGCRAVRPYIRRHSNLTKK